MSARIYTTGTENLSLTARFMNSANVLSNSTQYSYLGDGIYFVEFSQINPAGQYTIFTYKDGVVQSSVTFVWDGVSVSTSESPEQIASAVRNELTPELAATLISANNLGLTTQQATLLSELYSMMGLDPTKPLIVTHTNRSAGASIRQSIATTTNSTTIQRI